MHELSREDARRVAVRAQLLDAARPTDLFDVVRHLTAIQAEPTNAIAPSADLVLWSRLGTAYDPADLREALDQQQLIEHQGFIRAVEDMALLRAEMAVWPGTGDLRPWQVWRAGWIEANDACRRDVIELLRTDGPLPTSALPDTCEVPWRSTGWNDHRNVQRLLNLMVERGEVATVGREGQVPLWDLAERVYPDDPVPDVEEGRRILAERELRALGLVRRSQVGEPATVEGVRGKWRVDPGLLGGQFTGRVALLSPLDRLVFDRKRMTDIFAFDYQLEMYKPAAQRKWGYWALPILVGDELVGKVDATADRKAGVLRVDAIHEDIAFDESAVGREIEELADWLGLRPTGSIAA